MLLPELPHDEDAERAVIGSILLNREAIVAVAPWLKPEYFYDERHLQIYRVMLDLYHARTPPDTRTVSSELKRREQLDAVGGIGYLSETVDAVPTAYHVEYYARIVERTGMLRRLIDAGGKIAALGYDESGELDDTIAAAQQLLLDATLRPGTAQLVPLRQLVDDAYAALDRDAATGQPTGLIDYDAITGGLHRTDLVVLAARPSVGKTALAMTIAANVAAQGEPVLVFSLEMGRDQLFARIASMRSGLDHSIVRERRFDDGDLRVYLETLGKLADVPLYIDDTPGQRVRAMRDMGQRFRAAVGPIGLVVVDYLQLAQPGRRDTNRVNEVSDIARSLKNLAKELDCPVLALSQLSRAPEGRTSHIPMLSDLRESGEIEQAADLVVFIYRDELYDRDTDKKGIAELHIAKHRNGRVGVVPTRFDAATTTFQNLTPRASWNTGG